MKDCTRLDTEQALGLARNTRTNAPSRTRVVSSTTAGDEIVTELGGEWTANTTGAELRCSVEGMLGSITISKNLENNTYGYSLRLDSSQVGKGNSLDTVDECICDLETAVNLVVKLCDKLNTRLVPDSAESQNIDESKSEED